MSNLGYTERFACRIAGEETPRATTFYVGPWDNRCLLHRALANYDMGAHRRVLHRTVVTGTAPF